jgi:hypothetical protein
MSYEPKATYYAARHAFRYIRPGAVRSNADAQGLDVVAYTNEDGSIAVFGQNVGPAGDFELTIGGDAALPGSFAVQVSSQGAYAEDGEPATPSGRSVTVSLPSNSVFSLLGQ